MIELKNIEFLWLLILLIPMIYLLKQKSDIFNNIFAKDVLKRVQLSNRGLSKRTRGIFMIIAFIFSILALSRPVINNGQIKVKSSFINMIVAIDMSKSMFATDIYPSRFEFAKMKFFDLLKYLKNTKVALIGFSSKTFLISPLTEDFHTLKFLTKNLSIDSLSLKGTDILNTLKTANEMFGNNNKKALLLLTDGSDQNDFSKEIDYAKTHNIVVYIYNIGTSKGGMIKNENRTILKDKNGNIVIVTLNKKIKNLALNTNGAYMKYSLKKDDIKLLAQTIQNQFKAKKESQNTINDTRELFYIPLALSVLFTFMALFGLINRTNKTNQ